MLAPGSSIGDSVVVLLHKKRQAMGRIAGVDPLTDLALIKIEAGGLSYAKLGDSEKLRAGQWVVAIGNSPEQSHTVTAGIVCSKGRSKVVLPHTDDFIQIDAALHAGNAGGALVNLEGELVGITTHFPMPNTGYAIPINLAQRVMQDLIDDGKVTRGFIGMVSQDLDPGLAKALNLDSAIGALVVDVTPGGPADHAGLQRGDVVLQFAGEPVRNAKELPNSIAWQAPGQIVPVVVWRDSVKIVCDVIPKEWPATPMPQTVPSIEHKLTNKLGVHVRRLAPEVARQQDVRGVTVTQIDPGSPVEPMLSPGDIIQEIDRKTVDSVRDFQTVLQQLQSGETVLLLVRRGEKRFFVGVEVI
jgi:serine protease Do